MAARRVSLIMSVDRFDSSSYNPRTTSVFPSSTMLRLASVAILVADWLGEV